MALVGYEERLRWEDIVARCNRAKEGGHNYLLHLQSWSTRDDSGGISEEFTISFDSRKELFGGLLYEKVRGTDDLAGYGFKDFFALDGWTGTGRGPLSDDDYALQDEIKAYLDVREAHICAVGGYEHQSGLQRSLRRFFLPSADPLAEIRVRNGVIHCPHSGEVLPTQDRIAARCISDGLKLL